MGQNPKFTQKKVWTAPLTGSDMPSALGLVPFGKELLHLFNLVVKRSESTLVGNVPVQDDVNPFRKSSKGLVGAIIHRINLARDHQDNKIILDECSTVVEIDHVRNLIDCLERKNG